MFQVYFIFFLLIVSIPIGIFILRIIDKNNTKLRDADRRQQIQLENANGEPYANVEYLVTFEDGSTLNGMTDRNGNTERLKTESALAIVSIDLIVDSNCNESCSCGA